MNNLCFFLRQKIIQINFDFCITIKKTFNNTFYFYKISNPVVIEIYFKFFSPPNNTKYLVPSNNKSIYFIEPNIQRFGINQKFP